MNKPALQKGFLLTRQSYDYQGKPQINLWLSTDKGPAKLILSGEKPVFFIKQIDLPTVQSLLQNLNNNYSHKLLKLHTFSQQSVAGIYFNSLRAFYDARAILVQGDIEVFESNIRLEDRYLMERFVYAGVEFMGEQSTLAEQARKGYIEYRNIKIKPCDYVPTLNILSLDIECSEKGELYSIGFYTGKVKQGNHSGFSKIIMIQPEPLSEKEAAAEYIEWVINEVELLRALEKTIQHIDPDIRGCSEFCVRLVV